MSVFDLLILFFSCGMEIYILEDFYSSYLYKKKFKNSYTGLGITIGVTYSVFLVNCFENSFVNLILVPFIYFIFINFCYEGSIKEKIFSLIVAFATFLGSEFLFVLILKIPSLIGTDYSMDLISDMPWLLFTMKLFTYVMFIILKQFTRRSKRKINSKIYPIYLIIPITSLGMMVLLYYSGIDFSVSGGIPILLALCFKLQFIGNALLFFAFNKHSEQVAKVTQQELVIAKQNIDLKYYNQIDGMNKKYSEIIHNMNHYLKTIGELAKNHDNHQITGIINNIYEQLENAQSIVYCDNPTINAVFSEKKIRH